jgi:hypothetical protein
MEQVASVQVAVTSVQSGGDKCTGGGDQCTFFRLVCTAAGVEQLDGGALPKRCQHMVRDAFDSESVFARGKCGQNMVRDALDSKSLCARGKGVSIWFETRSTVNLCAQEVNDVSI